MSSSSSPSSPASPSSTPSRPRLIVTLKLSPASLRQFVDASSADSVSTPSKPASIADGDKTPLGAMSPATAASPVPTPLAASPAPTGPGSPPNLEGKAVNGVVEAVKRGGKRAGGGGGKPGPKKRKLDDGSALPPSRLGPKSSGGAINAGLRALDRTGSPCKKWSKAPFTLKSFTGFRFTVKAYGSPAPALALEEPKEPLSVAVSDAASFISAGRSDVGTPKDESSDPMAGVVPMEDVRSTASSSDAKNTPNGVTGGMNMVNGVHASTPEGVLVAPV
ncbi:hypothetical protein Dda_0709 [Drechslerella dactyloides]|uniref:Uncharacterized protein n=1 Tax=Drechslerella dactyloides TaxID=74499 RepID=A0AAD6NN89_DREDA|nr:hypothetical protein Dda_0709 [Drechslerella dactyloides]